MKESGDVCIVCDGTMIRQEERMGDYSIWKCDTCGLIEMIREV